MLKKLKITDWIIIAGVIVALLVGFFTVKHIRETAGKKIEATSKIAFQVFLRGVALTGNESPIKVGDASFITIRNVPYTELKVVDVKIDTKKTLLPNPNARASKEQFLLMDDYSQAFLYDVIVTLVDTAKITKDGAVVGGNKIKIGLPITLEGANYRWNGIVSNVQVVSDVQQQDVQNTNNAPQQPKPNVNKQDNNVG